MQVAAGILIKPPNTSNLRRAWNLTHWTLGRSALALGIANIFIGMYLSSDAYKNIIAQAVVLGGFYIIVMLKNDLEYLLVGCTPAEEEERLKAAHVIGTSQCLLLSKLELALTCCWCILCASVHDCATHNYSAAICVKLMGMLTTCRCSFLNVHTTLIAVHIDFPAVKCC